MHRALCLALVLAVCGMFVVPQPAQAQLDPFIGQLILVAFNFCPQGWMPANGQILPIVTNQALFALLGTTYGGDGRITFALPNLQGRVPIGQGQGFGLDLYSLGETGGAETHALTTNELPQHSHTAFGSTALPTSLSPAGKEVATQDRVKMYAVPGSRTPMANEAIGLTGGNAPFDIRPPFLTLQWCIAVNGVFPPRP